MDKIKKQAKIIEALMDAIAMQKIVIEQNEKIHEIELELTKLGVDVSEL